MATTRINLPIPGSGAGVAVSSVNMAAAKTIIVSGSFAATAVVEAAGDAGVFCAVAYFNGAGEKTIKVACTQMRVRVVGLGGPGTIDVIAEKGLAQSVALAVPAGDGNGASSGIPVLGSEMSCFAAGSFSGTISVELSPDDTAYAQAFRSFSQNDCEFKIVAGQFARVVRRGVLALNPGSPTVEVCGIVSTTMEPAGTTDITTELQAFINTMAALQVKATLAPGTYTISSTITIPTNADICGYGAVIQPVLAWALPLTQAVSVTGTDIMIEGIEIDSRGDERLAANVVAQNMMINNAQRVKLKNVVFRDAGAISGLPTGPSLILVSKDLIGDFDVNTGVVGPCTDVTVRGCRFIQAAGALVAFAVRCVSDWDAERAKTAFTNHTERIRFYDCEFGASGSGPEPFPFNVTEFAGGGTRDFWLENCTYQGKTVHCMDADKGCYRGQFIGNRVVDSGKSTTFVGDPATRFAPMVAHGSSATYLTTDILFQHNEVYDCTSASVDALEAFCLVQDAQRVRFLDNRCSNLNSGDFGYGVVFDRNIQSCEASRNRFYEVQGILSTNASGEGYDDLIVEDNFAPTCEGTILVFGSAAAGPSAEANLRISRNTGITTSVTGIACNVTDRWADAIIEDNDLTGNSDGFRIGCISSLVRNNWARNQAARGFRFASTATDCDATGNRSTGAAVAARIVEAGAVVKGGANSWNFFQELLTLASAASVAVNASLSNNFELELANAAVTLQAPSACVPGMHLWFALRQDGAGARALTFAAAYKFEAAAPALPVGANDEYRMHGIVRAVDGSGVATDILCTRTAALT